MATERNPYEQRPEGSNVIEGCFEVYSVPKLMADIPNVDINQPKLNNLEIKTRVLTTLPNEKIRLQSSVKS